MTITWAIRHGKPPGLGVGQVKGWEGGGGGGGLGIYGPMGHFCMPEPTLKDCTKTRRPFSDGAKNTLRGECKTKRRQGPGDEPRAVRCRLEHEYCTMLATNLARQSVDSLHGRWVNRLDNTGHITQIHGANAAPRVQHHGSARISTHWVTETRQVKGRPFLARSYVSGPRSARVMDGESFGTNLRSPVPSQLQWAIKRRRSDEGSER